MKVIIDTSVVVSAALKDRTPEEVILFVLARPEFTWTASTEITGEYITVLKRGKFKLTDETCNGQVKPEHILLAAAREIRSNMTRRQRCKDVRPLSDA